MAGLIPRLDARSVETARELLGVRRRDDPVLLPPDEQGGSPHAMDPLLQPLVRDGPEKLPRGTHGPLKPDAHQGPRFRILRLSEHPPRGFALGVPEDMAGELL